MTSSFAIAMNQIEKNHDKSAALEQAYPLIRGKILLIEEDIDSIKGINFIVNYKKINELFAEWGVLIKLWDKLLEVDKLLNDNNISLLAVANNNINL